MVKKKTTKKMTARKLIWAHSLIKNEEKWIWYALNSVLPFVDKILVWDTGSTDNTVKIVKAIKSNKIEFKQLGEVRQDEFGKIRNKMIKKTNSDWILILDGDEVWPKASFLKLKQQVKKAPKSINTFCVQPINFVGDIRFIHPEVFEKPTPLGPKGFKGFYSNRIFRSDIKGLKAKGLYGKEGFYAQNNKTLIEDKKRTRFLQDVYYWHMSYLPRSSSRAKDKEVLMRSGKRKYEIGIKRPARIKIPEVFYQKRPGFVPSPFYYMDKASGFRSFLQTPFKKIKRKLTNWQNKV